ncbi:putative ATPase, archaeal AAA+ ATPase superfamily (plasmid) [Nostoc flagelliforme CCNUN1]|uniref:Putative ATPase, archaeal AAA+ ATPase superfamily n=1 Tax=Nostoc flagelliforme CCNUN1 TaxID=2038116 RepID=A0A2K8T9R5_9NOSO|nr:NB-ARC domain-containing protein [Nostoc flagelliforme]AUB44400.1 putative ATPase, archaeal AAA+ ATPase superfamily [Nostoc flagelliforme CCNUN1]
MITSNNLDIDTILEILEEQVLKSVGRRLSEAEIIVIKGSWDGKDYKEMASDGGYNSYYLQQKVAPPLWNMLSQVIGNGVKVKKIYLKNILFKLAKNDYVEKLEFSEAENERLVGKTLIYGELPKTKYFHGRQKEINYLKRRIASSKESSIALIGVGGVGKSSLVVKLVEEILTENSDIYECVVWKTIEAYSSLEELVDGLIKVLRLKINDESLQEKIVFLLKNLQSRRYLLVLDGFEGLVQAENFAKRVEYGKFLFQLIDEQHKSYTIVTSQLPLEEIIEVNTNLIISSIKIQGLDENAGISMLHEKGLYGESCKKLIETYRGNPSELEVVAERINRFWGGDVEKFFEYKTTLMGQQVQSMLNQQFRQAGLLNDLQKNLMIYLAEKTSEELTSIPFPKILEDIKKQFIDVSTSEVIIALEVLEQRSLIEVNKKTIKQEISYSLQPVIKKYILVDPLGLVYKSSNQSKANNYNQE